LELIDGPIVLDSNDDAGAYAAAAGYRTPWPGEAAVKSIDSGTTWTNVKTITTAASLGHATTLLGNFDGGNVVDERNTANVQMHTGTLSTITRAQLLNGGNLAVWGDEYLQFQRADLIATDIYSLSGLLRGRFGTEQYMGTHTAADRFVLFTANVVRMPDTLSQLNVPATWRAVTMGQSIDDANDIAFTNTGAGLKPLSVSHLAALDNGDGTYTVQWIRRGRIAGSWRDGVDVPLSEATESYLVEVNGAIVATVSSPTADVTAAPGDVVTVYQLSGSVGRGFQASVTLE
jgi:hypothetical protein